MKRVILSIIILIVIVVFLVSIAFFFNSEDRENSFINSFEECVAAGYPVMESYPEQCRTPDGMLFIRNIVLDLDKPINIIAENLKIPWEVALLPDGTTLITERPGHLVIIKNGNTKRISIDGVYHIGEGGLLGMALHPDFSKNNFLYLYLTYKDGNDIKNKVERHTFENSLLSDKKIIIDNIPGSSNHNGGRIMFGPDKYLYITTGDSGNSSLAQDTNSMAGKILRLTDDASIPSDNPFKNAVYSYGHRNPQGLAWDYEGRLWSTEHGRSGVLSGFDELNLIEKGKNYGWPTIQGDEKKLGMISPIIHSGATSTWAPAGITFINGNLFFGGLRGQTLYEVKIHGANAAVTKEHFVKQFGRIRAVISDVSGNIYITTSNTDGRGKPKENDDKLIKIKILK